MGKRGREAGEEMDLPGVMRVAAYLAEPHGGKGRAGREGGGNQRHHHQIGSGRKSHVENAEH